MIKKFLSYVEITTKITSVFAFLMTLAYIFYIKQPINWELTLIFFASMFLFDLTTTAINNYIDTKTNTQTLQFDRTAAKAIIYLLLGASAFLGLYLAYLTDIVVLLLGGFCFLVGVFYTYGPVPISRQPLGEVFSGFFYGFLIPFILLYINMPRGTFLTLNIGIQIISIDFMVLPLIKIILLSIVPFSATANIMLANNICDVEKDVKVKRHTLPYYLGGKALFLFAGIYYAAYTAIAAMSIFGIISPFCLVSLLTIIKVQKNINSFFREQSKSKTFILSVKNYIIIMGSFTLSIFIGRWI